MLNSSNIDILEPKYAGLFSGEAESLDGDYTLEAALRYIYLKKRNEEELLRTPRLLYFNYAYNSDDFIDSCARNVVLNVTYGDYDVLSKTSLPSQWRLLEDKPYAVNKYLSQFSPTSVYINEEEQKVAVLVSSNRMNKAWQAALASTLLFIFTWFYPDKDSMSDDKELMQAISAKDTEKAAYIINSALDGLDIRRTIFHRHLDGKADIARKKQIENTKTILGDKMEEIRRLEASISSAYVVYNEKLALLNALTEVPERTSEEMFRFFYNHKNIDIISSTDESVTFSVTDTIEFYDEDEFKRTISRRGSYWYFSIGDRERAVYKALFADRKGKIRTRAVFTLRNMSTLEIASRSAGKNNVCPHPHIDEYACWGDNSRYIQQYAKNGDWEMQIEQAIGAVKNLNFGDSVVIPFMIDWFKHNPKIKCIEVGDDLISMEDFQNMIESEKKDG